MMKKTLLATTALLSVAYAGTTLAQESMVMAPQGADASLGGFYEFGINSFSQSVDTDADGLPLDEMRTYGDSELFLSFSRTSDTGLEYGMDVQMEIVNGGESIPNEDDQTDVDEASIYLGGPWGRFVIGNNDPASDSFLTYLGAAGSYGQDDAQQLPKTLYLNRGGRFNATDTGNTTSRLVQPFALNPSYDDGSKIAYFSPDLDGFRFGVSWEDTGDEDDDISYGGQYTGSLGDWGELTFRAAYRDDTNLAVTSDKAAEYEIPLGARETHESVSYGFELDFFDDFTAIAGYSKIDRFLLGAGDADFDHRIRTIGYGIGYQINRDLYVAYYVADSEAKNAGGFGGDQDGEFASISASYVFTPGLSLDVSYNTFEMTQTVVNGGGEGQPNDGKYVNEGEEVVVEIEAAF